MYGYHSTVKTGGIEFELAAAYSVQDRDRSKLAMTIWVLVRWCEEDEESIIPSSWVVSPEKLPTQAKFPVKGVCFWKKKCNKYDAEILAVAG